MLTKKQKQNAMKEFAKHEKDTGSAEVQIAMLTKRIKVLTDHLKENPKDFSSRRGLLMLVGKRRRFLQYLKNSDAKSYEKVAKKLGIGV